MQPDDKTGVEIPALSWTALAEALEVTRKTLTAWRAVPDAPTGTGLADWKAFKESRSTKHAGSKELRDEKLRWEIELLKTKDAREKRRTIDRAEVSALLLHIATRGRTMLYERLETEAPPKLDGLPAAAQRPILRDMADSIADAMADLVAQFEKDS